MNNLDYVRRETSEYLRISETFNGKFSKRTGAPYMRHIDQGLTLLDVLGADAATMKAWCVHPLFQNDEYFVKMMNPDRVEVPTSSSYVATLAMEYRKVANAYLVPDTYARFPKASTIEAVNTMLVVDKVQNYREVKLHRTKLGGDDRTWELDDYFKAWRRALGVGDTDMLYLERKLG